MAFGSGLGINPLLNAPPDMWKYINTAEQMSIAAEQAQQAQQAQLLAKATHVNDAHQYMYHGMQQAAQQGYDGSKDVSISPMRALATRAHELFINRMKGVRDTGFKIKLHDFTACHVYQDKVYLFYMFDGKEGVVNESIDVFPSDQLIAQFRMVLA